VVNLRLQYVALLSHSHLSTFCPTHDVHPQLVLIQRIMNSATPCWMRRPTRKQSQGHSHSVRGFFAIFRLSHFFDDESDAPVRQLQYATSEWAITLSE
jgi:hypothetical protein